MAELLRGYSAGGSALSFRGVIVNHAGGFTSSFRGAYSQSCRAVLIVNHAGGLHHHTAVL